LKASCTLQGLQMVLTFDETTGCKGNICGTPDDCAVDIPVATYDRCREEKGELVVQTDAEGCIQFSECIVQGSEDDISVGEIVNIPSATELLEMIFTLDLLEVKMQDLQAGFEAIADYHAEAGNDEQEKYDRIVIAIQSVITEIGRIQALITDAASDEEVTKGEVYDIKYSIKFLEVMIDDVVWIALTPSAALGVGEGEVLDCGDDGECFSRAYRICQPVLYYPELEEKGESSIWLEVQGLQGNSCVIFAELPDEGLDIEVEGISAPYTMTCTIADYASGLRDPSTDLFPTCEGSLAELILSYYLDAAAGEACEESDDCASGLCEEGVCVEETVVEEDAGEEDLAEEEEPAEEEEIEEDEAVEEEESSEGEEVEAVV
jgi:hypothetical protein